MAEEEDEPELERDDCERGEDGDVGLANKGVLEEAFEDLTEEIKQFVANQPLLDDERQPENTNTHNQPGTSTTTSTGKNKRRKQVDVKPSQKKIAEELVRNIQRSQPHINPENFDYFDMFIIIPKFICLGWY